MTRTARSSAGKAVFGAVVAATLALTGCTAASDSGQASFDPNEKVDLHISWWGSDARTQIMNQVIQSFEAKYPNVTVEAEAVGAPDDLFNRLTTDFAAGGTTAPDVFALGGAKPQEYGGSGQLLDLSTVSNYLDTSKYPDFTTTNATVGGKLYGLPTGGNAIGVLINKTIFQNAGVPLPAANWTWDDFVSAANAISNSPTAGKNVVGVDLRIQDILGTYVAQYTKDGIYGWDGKLEVGADTIQKWFEMEQSLEQGGGLPDPSVVVENQNLTPDQTLFGTGKAAMTFSYSNQISAYAAGTNGGDVEIVAPPTSTGVSGVAVLPSQFWAINAHTAHPAASALLVDWLLNQPDPATVIKSDRGLPFNPDTLAVVQPLLTGGDAQAAAYLQDILKVGVVAPPQPAGGAILNDLSQREESDVLFGKASPTDAAADWVKQMTDALAAAQ